MSRLRLRNGRASKSRLRGQFDKAFIPLNRTQFALVPRGSALCVLPSEASALAIKHNCTTGKERRITRWEHEHILDVVQRRLDEHSEKMRQRREVVEHRFGTIKARMGARHFLMKTLPRVDAEMDCATGDHRRCSGEVRVGHPFRQAGALDRREDRAHSTLFPPPVVAAARSSRAPIRTAT